MDNEPLIDWVYERYKKQRRDSIKNGRFNFLNTTTKYLITSILSGILVGLSTALLNGLTFLLNSFREGYCKKNILLDKTACCAILTDEYECQAFHYWRNEHSYFTAVLIYSSFSFGFALLASLLKAFFFPSVSASGIPEIKATLSGYTLPDAKIFFSFKTLISKSLSICLCVASGLWVGKEGPFVHIASNIAILIASLFPEIRTSNLFSRQILIAAISSGIAASFNAPVGGVLFALEQVTTSSFPSSLTGSIWYEFLCSAFSVVTLQLLRSWQPGAGFLSYISLERYWSYLDLLPFIFISVLCGSLGSVLVRLNIKVFKKYDSFPKWFSICLVALLSLITCFVSIPALFDYDILYNPTDLFFQVSNSCSPSSASILCEAPPWITSLVLFASATVGLLLTGLTYGMQIPGGILVPSLAIGACLGRCIGTILRSNFSSLAGSTVYAIVGATAFLSSTTRLTVSLVVIIYELTGAFTVVLPLMLATLLSRWISNFVNPFSIYDSWLHFKSIPYFPISDADSISSFNLNLPMTPSEKIYKLPLDRCTIHQMECAFKHSTHPYIAVVQDQTEFFVGLISREKLGELLHISPLNEGLFTQVSSTLQPEEQSLSSIDLTFSLSDHLYPATFTLNHSTPPVLILKMFREMGITVVALLVRGKLHGIITKLDILEQAISLRSHESMLFSQARQTDTR
ncbi:ClC chloride channel, variant [Schizosaccharomyces cryophilus OY26]|uniref:ClC chloride channel, variant n=1 Tax=Schizosaccharomyces cryophilus (strain OY26 / ATCC MYA-4695 / CBS 11777 / NBRC 106824 / NRRL Y48691) TaxID=653667 RepID=S9X1Y8_SCHCR|nr:ClC chloride channel, variant [Schizosaccharomyces cryophilus OY26]EPY51122.1 ClC chloride channel, variant [Schizosaccharomyces cryophilus OY26]